MVSPSPVFFCHSKNGYYIYAHYDSFVSNGSEINFFSSKYEYYGFTLSRLLLPYFIPKAVSSTCAQTI
jgi:hypothetical protein